MAKSIEIAIDRLHLDLSEVRGSRSFRTAVENYLEAVFHQHAENGVFRYFETLVELSYINDDDSITIKRYDDGDRYVWILKPVCPEKPNYYSDYVDGFFNSTDCDQYVEDALWALYETILAHGMMHYKKDLLNSH